MLYKKVHRQYIRQFRVGREYKHDSSNVVCEVIKEPTIGRVAIWLEGYDLIRISSGKIRYKDVFIWLD